MTSWPSSTSSDTLSAQTNTYAITAAKAVASPSVTLSTTAAGATNVTYTTDFTTSSTGALAADYSTITLAAPAGTVFNSNSSYTIQDVTTATNCGLANWVTSNAGATVTLTVAGGCTIAAGATVQVTASGVSNPGAISTGDLIAVTTSSDTASASTEHLRHHGRPGGVLAFGLALVDRARGDQCHVHHRLHHVADGGPGGRLGHDHLGRPGWDGLQLGQLLHDQDVTTATNCGLETWVTSNAGATVTLTVGCTIGAGATVQVVATGVSNPATASSGDVLTITTSSDILSAHTNTYSIGGAVSSTTSLNAVTSPITYGSETTETFTGTVTGQSGDGNPEGTVSVYEGSPTATQLCQSALTASGANAATFSCALTASQLAAGTYSSVDAVYAPGGPSSSNPGFTYTASTSTPDPELHGEPVPSGADHHQPQRGHLAHHLRRRDHRDLHRDGDRPER